MIHSLEIVQALEMSEATNVQNLAAHGSPFVNTLIGAEDCMARIGF
jgi:hypothetical protein